MEYDLINSYCRLTEGFSMASISETFKPVSPVRIVHHDDVIKWKHFPRYWPFVRGIHRSPVNSPHKGQWRRALMFFLICTRINGWVNNSEAGDLRRNRAHYDFTVMHIKGMEYDSINSYCRLTEGFSMARISETFSSVSPVDIVHDWCPMVVISQELSCHQHFKCQLC